MDVFNHHKSSKIIAYFVTTVLIFYIIANFLPFKLYNYFFILLLLISLPFLTFPLNNPIKYENKFLLSLPIFFMIVLLSSYLNKVPIAEIDTYTRFVLCIPIYFLLRNISVSIKLFCYGLIISSILAGSLSLYDYYILNLARAGHISSIVITYGNMCMTLFILMLVCLRFHEYLKINKNIMYVALIMSLLGWLLTFTRGSLIGLLVCTPFLFSTTFSKNIKAKLIVFVVISIMILSTPMKNRISTIINDLSQINYNQIEKSTVNVSLKERLIYIDVALRAIKEKPLIGIGLDGFADYIEKEYDNIDFTIADHAHNDFFDIFSKTGIFGLISLIYLFFISIYYFVFYFKYSSNKLKIYASMGIVTCLSQIGFMLTQSQLSHHQATLFFVTLLLLTASQVSYLVRFKSDDDKGY